MQTNLSLSQFCKTNLNPSVDRSVPLRYHIFHKRNMARQIFKYLSVCITRKTILRYFIFHILLPGSVSGLIKISGLLGAVCRLIKSLSLVDTTQTCVAPLKGNKFFRAFLYYVKNLFSICFSNCVDNILIFFVFPIYFWKYTTRTCSDKEKKQEFFFVHFILNISLCLSLVVLFPVMSYFR